VGKRTAHGLGKLIAAMGAGVYTAAERPFDQLPHVAIVITGLRERKGQPHVGILHRDESTNVVRMLHLDGTTTSETVPQKRAMRGLFRPSQKGGRGRWPHLVGR
jgi:hypothetical protein